jgi:hypothetical protein
MRPQGVNDLQVLWAIRDIPTSLITFEQRSLLYYFLSVLGNYEKCYYSISQLAKNTGMSKRWLTYRLKELEESKFLNINRPCNQGRGMANEYTLNYSLILQFLNKGAQNAIKDAKSASFDDNKGAESAYLNPKRVHKTTQKGADSAPHRYKQDINKRKEREPLPDFFKPDDQRQRLSEETARRCNTSIDNLLTKFKNIQKAKDNTSADWNANYENFLISERPSTSYVNHQTNEMRSTVPDYGPGHPLWEEKQKERAERKLTLVPKEEEVDISILTMLERKKIMDHYENVMGRPPRQEEYFKLFKKAALEKQKELNNGTDSFNVR